MIAEFAKEKVFWTKKMNLKLVKFIESSPNIWNPKHPKYTSVEYRDQTYAEFASKYGNEFTGQAVKDRWTNIRSTFSNYLRKLKASGVRADGEVYKVNWHLWDACSFLLKVNKKNKKLKPSECLDEESKDNIALQDQEELYSEDGNLSTKSTEEANPSCQNIANGILNAFRGIQNNIFDLDDTRYTNIGHTICNRLSQMSSLEASKVQVKIMEILWMYHDDNPLNPNAVKAEMI